MTRAQWVQLQHTTATSVHEDSHPTGRGDNRILKDRLLAGVDSDVGANLDAHIQRVIADAIAPLLVVQSQNNRGHRRSISWWGRSMQMLGVDTLPAAKGRVFVNEFVGSPGNVPSWEERWLPDFARGMLEVWFDGNTSTSKWVRLSV